MAKSRQQRKADRKRKQGEVEPAVSVDSAKEPAGEEAEPQSAKGAKSESVERASVVREPESKRRVESKSPKRSAPKPSLRERSRVITFLIEVRGELRRVQWPDRQTLLQATTVVIVFVLVSAAYLGGLDFGFNKLVQALLL